MAVRNLDKAQILAWPLVASGSNGPDWIFSLESLCVTNRSTWGKINGRRARIYVLSHSFNCRLSHLSSVSGIQVRM